MRGENTFAEFSPLFSLILLRKCIQILRWDSGLLSYLLLYDAICHCHIHMSNNHHRCDIVGV